MDTTTTDAGVDRVGAFLEHYGKKGMRWGVRKAERSTPSSSGESSTPASSVPGGKAKGFVAKVSTDKTGRIQTREVRTISTKPKPISDEELRQRINRINMEQQYAKLTAPVAQKTKLDHAKAIVGDILLDVGKKQATAVLLNQTTKVLQKKGWVPPPKEKKDKK